MDKQQARFILRSFRPDGADASDPDFAAALQLAVQDRDLGDWLARERADDAGFSAALQAISIPERLRNEILDAMAWERGELPDAITAEDERWICLLETISPPPQLRSNILAAMTACAATRRNAVPIWRKIGIPAAAAAAIALAFSLPSTIWKSGGNEETASENTGSVLVPMPVDLVRAGFINTFSSGALSVETGRGSHQEIMNLLQERGLPCPTCIPPALRAMDGVICREIMIEGRRGTVVCYEQGENTMIHLVIFRAEEISDPLPRRSNVSVEQHGEWAAAAWRNSENAFVLLGNFGVDQISALF